MEVLVPGWISEGKSSLLRRAQAELCLFHGPQGCWLRVAPVQPPAPGRFSQLAPSSPSLMGSTHHCLLAPAPQGRQQQRPFSWGPGLGGEGLTTWASRSGGLKRPLGRMTTCCFPTDPCSCPLILWSLPAPYPGRSWGGGAPWSLGTGSPSGCPRLAWLQLLSPDYRILAGSRCSLQPKPGAKDPEEAGGLVPDLAWGPADREGCI